MCKCAAHNWSFDLHKCMEMCAKSALCSAIEWGIRGEEIDGHKSDGSAKVQCVMKRYTRSGASWTVSAGANDALMGKLVAARNHMQFVQGGGIVTYEKISVASGGGTI